MEDSVEVVELGTAMEFLEYLDLKDARWGDGIEPSWVFRGHADASWALQPRSWRVDGAAVLRPLSRMLRDDHDWDVPDVNQEVENDTPRGRGIAGSLQRATEYEAVQRFVVEVDRQGLPVPDGHLVPSGLEFLDSTNAYGWPVDYEHIGTTAFCLAQHHGIPTPLLDWTENPLTAALFAAEGAFAECERVSEAAAELGPDGPPWPPEGSLAVWALESGSIPTQRAVSGELEPLLLRVTCPRSDNNFLHAQDGLFLWYRRAGEYFLREGRWPTYEEILLGRNAGPGALLRKITIPKTEAAEVLRLLLRLRHSRARLMPTYDNVARFVTQRWHF